MEDVTEKYKYMIDSFECDFSLALEGRHSFSDLDREIDECNEYLLNDIELLKELSYGLRHGLLKIIKVNS